jgi:hypothetical protein
MGGRPGKASSLLDRVLPTLQQYEIISKGGMRYLMVPKGPGEKTYALPMLTVAQGHYWQGEACLALAAEGSATDAVALLDRVQAECRRALAINPVFYEAHALGAKTFLFRDALTGTPSAETLVIARGRIAVATPQLWQMARVREVLASLRPPVARGRVQALGCLAMAQASLEEANAAKDGATSAKHFKNSLAWLQRALELDPSFGEAAWIKASVHHALSRKLKRASPEAAAWQSQECIKALSLVRPDSPRYPKAQEGLQALSVAPGRN